MSEDAEDDDGKTFEPTEKKLREAVERGDLPVSREAALLGGLGATLVVCSLTLRDGAARLADTLAHLFEDPARWRLDTGADAAALVGALMGAAASFVVPVFAVFLVAGLAVSFAQNAPSVVLDRIAPKLGKLSPAAGLARLVGKAGAVEFAKSLAKLVVMGAWPRWCSPPSATRWPTRSSCRPRSCRTASWRCW